MSKITKYSVIVPVYNAESTLSRCVDSILCQTLSDFELILIDDGSTDSSSTIIDSYSENDDRVLVIHKSNGGVSSARNEGLNIAKGEWILFADADDEVKPNWIQEFDKLDSNADLGIQSAIFASNTPEIKGIIGGGNLNDSICMAVGLLIENGILGYNWSKRFRRDIIERHDLRYDHTLRFREDDVFTLQYCEYAKTWASTSQAEYIYYVPSADKQYGTSATRCTEQIFRSLNKIFKGVIPERIKQSQAWGVKGAAIERILAGEKLTEELIEIYKDVIVQHTNGLKSKLLNNVIINNIHYPYITSTLIKLLHKLIS